MKRAWLVWGLLVIPTWIVFALCAHWEPILRDGWGHYHWHQYTETTLSNVLTFAHDSYTHNNPRIGQTLTLLVYTQGPWHEVVTPIVELGMLWLLTVLALGRRPQLGRVDDAFVFATIAGMACVTVPQLGPMLFYRPFTANYLFGFVICLLLLVPYRLHAETPRPRGWWWIPVLLVAGVAAGMANEHTGPALGLVLVVAIALFIRRGERIAPWMIAGLVGLVAGGLALYFAPGQSIRYNGLANTSMAERITGRSLYANVRVVVIVFAYVWPLVAWLVLAAIEKIRGATVQPVSSRARVVSAIVLVATGFAIAITLLVSPKQGPRLYFASVALICTGVASLVVPLLVHRITRGLAWLFAVTALAWALGSLVTTYHTVGSEFAERLWLIETAPRRGVVTITPYSVDRSRWFLGEDFGADRLRFNLAFNRGLAGIVLDRPAEAIPDDPHGL
jgi:drug/metabolite transporter (DMT)-like permease